MAKLLAAEDTGPESHVLGYHAEDDLYEQHYGQGIFEENDDQEFTTEGEGM